MLGDFKDETGPPQFGGNDGRQGIFDPNDPRQKALALARLKELYSTYGERLQPNYTGPTGLASNDMSGYAKQMNAVTEAINIQNVLQGKSPLNVKFSGKTIPSQITPSIADNPASTFNTNWNYDINKQDSPPVAGLRAAADEEYKKKYPGAGR